MLRVLSLACLAGGILILLEPGQARADQKLFVASKCTRCHAISALGIEKEKSDTEDEDSGGDEGGKVTPPDLSGVGKFHDAAFIQKFVMKEIAHVAHEGLDNTKKHRFKYKGSQEDLPVLAKWLAEQKSEPVKK